MASTVNTAFDEFLGNTVRLDSAHTVMARKSCDHLIDILDSFSGNSDFFNLVSNCHLKFGSFARKTKIRPLDDIDLMICISGDGRTYTQSGATYYITGIDSDTANSLLDDNTGFINSTKVINRFIKKLASLSDYNQAEMHKNHEAATLKLKSYTWNFDIVPCWHMDIDKFLIPDGSGNWKLTDPRIDNQRTTDINQKHKGKLLDVIRIMKYWNNRTSTFTMGSYLLECMILEVYEGRDEKNNYRVDLEFRDLLNTLSTKILYDVYDPKGIQGNMNTFSTTDRQSISSALITAYKKANEASFLEFTEKDQKAAIKKWGEVLGCAFPDFT